MLGTSVETGWVAHGIGLRALSNVSSAGRSTFIAVPIAHWQLAADLPDSLSECACWLRHCLEFMTNELIGWAVDIEIDAIAKKMVMVDTQAIWGRGVPVTTSMPRAGL